MRTRNRKIVIPRVGYCPPCLFSIHVFEENGVGKERERKKKWGVRHDAISEGSITIRKRKEEKGGSHFLHQLECFKGRGCGTVFLSESSLYFLPNGNATLRECDCPFTIFHFLKEMLCEFVDPSALRTSKIGQQQQQQLSFSVALTRRKQRRERKRERKREERKMGKDR